MCRLRPNTAPWLRNASEDKESNTSEKAKYALSEEIAQISKQQLAGLQAPSIGAEVTVADQTPGKYRGNVLYLPYQIVVVCMRHDQPFFNRRFY